MKTGRMLTFVSGELALLAVHTGNVRFGPRLLCMLPPVDAHIAYHTEVAAILCERLDQRALPRWPGKISRMEQEKHMLIEQLTDSQAHVRPPASSHLWNSRIPVGRG